MTLSLTINETFKWLSSLPVLMQESSWWWQCRDRYIMSLSPHLRTPFLKSLTVSVEWTLSTMFIYFFHTELRSCVNRTQSLLFLSYTCSPRFSFHYRNQSLFRPLWRGRPVKSYLIAKVALVIMCNLACLWVRFEWVKTDPQTRKCTAKLWTTLSLFTDRADGCSQISGLDSWCAARVSETDPWHCK